MLLPTSDGGPLAPVNMYAVRIGKQHVRDGVTTLQTEKTDTPVDVTILPPLEAALQAGPTGDLAFICGADGEPLTKEAFGNAFRDVCRAAGVNKSAHTQKVQGPESSRVIG